MNPSLVAEVERWIAGDPDDDDRATLRQLLDDRDETELHRRFDHPLTFGTAGLRGPEMAGPAGMNRATVRRTTFGVLSWLKEKGLDGSRGVVVGRDARLGSERFNDEAVSVLLGGGVAVYEMPGALPTPFVPYCVKALGAVAGVMITASHNPPQDNGYKLYSSDGAQIIPPDDEIIERWASSPGEVILADRSTPGHSYISESLFEEYRRHFVARFGVGRSDLRITYTPLHGVGGAVMAELFAEAGFDSVSLVNEQFAPDGTFPTLPFPNPEEPGALDLAIATATAHDAELIIANDPDADRLGAAVRTASGWRVLRGDEIGWLLASSLLAEIKEKGETVATTIVSSSLLEVMAASAGVPCVTTLTGFKWISRAAGEGVLGFGYEEALGFAVDPCVADKDGLSAALALSSLAHSLALEGVTLIERLDELEERFGVHATAQLSLRAGGPEDLPKIRSAVERLVREPPSVLGDLDVSEVVELNRGWRGLSPTEGVVLVLQAMGRVIVRPSGTEAKLKAYLEITPPRDGSLAHQRAAAQERLDAVKENLATLLVL
ncbi:MAG: Phosphomannomutase [Acidimicrobiaceae bacterium]|nr:Phosphomannomutase [Acidimicrobiaceae bacterium]